MTRQSSLFSDKQPLTDEKIESDGIHIGTDETEKDVKELKEARQNMPNVSRSVANIIHYYNKKLDEVERSKEEKYKLYRQMEQYPEVSDAIDEHCDEAINFDTPDNNCCRLEIDNEELGKKTIKAINKEFDHLMFDVISINQNAWDWFREFITYAESFYSMVLDREDPENGISDVKKLPTRITHAIFENGTGDLKHVIQKDANGNEISVLAPEYVAYGNSGTYQIVNKQKKRSGWERRTQPKVSRDKKNEKGSGQLKLYTSFLEKARRPFYQLRQLEDAIVIYRLARAPERLVFKVDVGRMQPRQAEAYIKKLMHKYKNDLNYDPSSGTIENYSDVMSMLENFWLPQTSDGKGTDVSTLSGGENLGKLEDVQYFLRKLYRALKIPVSRLEKEYKYRSGSVDDITRQEIKFSRFVKRQVWKFAEPFKEILWTHLQLKGYVEKHDLSKSDIDICFYPANLFETYRKMQILERKGRVFGQFAGQIGKDRGGLSRQWVQKEVLQMNDEEYEQNKEWLEEESEGDDQGGMGGRF